MKVGDFMPGSLARPAKTKVRGISSVDTNFASLSSIFVLVHNAVAPFLVNFAGWFSGCKHCKQTPQFLGGNIGKSGGCMQHHATPRYRQIFHPMGIVDRRPDIKASAKGNASAEITEKR